jgi:hypothetical protein
VSRVTGRVLVSTNTHTLVGCLRVAGLSRVCGCGCGLMSRVRGYRHRRDVGSRRLSRGFGAGHPGKAGSRGPVRSSSKLFSRNWLACGAAGHPRSRAGPAGGWRIRGGLGPWRGVEVGSGSGRETSGPGVGPGGFPGVTAGNADPVPAAQFHTTTVTPQPARRTQRGAPATWSCGGSPSAPGVHPPRRI